MLKGVRDPPDVGTGKWYECNLHRIGKAWVEPAAAENLEACAKRGVGKHNLGEHMQHRSGIRHCYEREPLGSTELLAYLVCVRLRESQDQTVTEM